MSVDSLTPPPSCPNDALIFNCQVNFASFLIRWNHVAFKEIEFIGASTVVGNTSTTSNGQVVANLTRTTLISDARFMFSSTLIIHPPLNSLNINNSNIMCEGSGGTGLRSDDSHTSLYGEHCRMYLIMHEYITRCLCIYPLQVPLPLLMM